MVAAVALIVTVSQHCCPGLPVARAATITVTVTAALRRLSGQRHARACATVLDVASNLPFSRWSERHCALQVSSRRVAVTSPVIIACKRDLETKQFYIKSLK